MTMTEFLLARIQEDENAARAADLKVGDPRWFVSRVSTTVPQKYTVRSTWCLRPIAKIQDIESVDPFPDPSGVLDGGAAAAHIARWDPARVLAECEARREVVMSADDGVLRALAAIHSDHPDYDPAWV